MADKFSRFLHDRRQIFVGRFYWQTKLANFIVRLTSALEWQTGSRQFSQTVTMDKFETCSVSKSSSEIRRQSSAIHVHTCDADATQVELRRRRRCELGIRRRLTELQVEAGWSLGRPQSQRVHVVVAISRHRTVVRHCQHNLPTHTSTTHQFSKLQPF